LKDLIKKKAQESFIKIFRFWSEFNLVCSCESQISEKCVYSKFLHKLKANSAKKALSPKDRVSIVYVESVSSSKITYSMSEGLRILIARSKMKDENLESSQIHVKSSLLAIED
ncbi:MAG: hypothetical protein MHPSP_002653, partial [Paramarteilia canceri]